MPGSSSISSKRAGAEVILPLGVRSTGGCRTYLPAKFRVTASSLRYRKRLPQTYRILASTLDFPTSEAEEAKIS